MKINSYEEMGQVNTYILLPMSFLCGTFFSTHALTDIVRWLIELVNNFVNFSAIYMPKQTALIEAGSLVIDGRRLDFCLKVANRAAHKAVAVLSNIYLVYVEVLEKEGGAVVYQLMAPVTGGEAGRLRVGKRGLFIDLKDKEYDAIVTEIVDNPISVKQAAFAPFRRAAAAISSKIEQYVATAQASQESAMQARAEAGVTEAQAQVEAALDDVNLNVHAEEIRLEQVLVNLIANALDAVSGMEGATIAIGASRSFCG